MKEKEECRRQVRETDMEDYDAIDPNDLLKKAKKEDPMPTYRTASDYANVMQELRSKHFTWEEVAQWFQGNGVPYSMPALRSAYRNKTGE